jgi:hypothetical protein
MKNNSELDPKSKVHNSVGLSLCACRLGLSSLDMDMESLIAEQQARLNKTKVPKACII